MASTYSDLKFELIGTGEQSGTWGNTTNTNLGTAIQEAITGSADVTFASGTVTLTLTDTNATQTARNLRLNLTGTSGGAQNLVVPDIEKFYLVNNACADAITVKNSTGATVAVPASKAMLLFSTGSAVVDAVTHMSSLTLTTALAIAQGGTGATTADTALDNLGGTTVGKGVFKAATAAAAQQAMDTEVGVDVLAYVAPGTSGNVLTSNGTVWQAAAAAAFDTGTRMIFAQNAAPTGWTKDTTNYNQHAMRIVTGTAGGTAGTVDFSTAFTSQAVTGSVTITAVAGSAGATTLSTPQIPSHTHSYTGNANTKSDNTISGNITGDSAKTTGATGGGGSHTHPFSFSSGSGTFSGTAINLAVKYLDVITATKD
jgi:hypothetical protein